MADDRENLQEDHRGSDETKLRPIEETNVISTSKAEARENLQEDQRRRNRKRSRSIEETKGRNLDLRSSKSGRKSDERHEIDSRSRAEKKDKEDSGLRINKPGKIRDYRDSSKGNTRENQQQQRHRDVDMKRRRHETESRIWHEDRGISPDWRRSESRLRYDESPRDYRRSEYEWRDYERSLEYRRSESEWRDYERTQEYRGNESEWRYDEKTQRRYERLPSGAYIVHPGKNDCYSYFRTGTCPYGRSCKFNHPTHLTQELPERTNVPVCKYFLIGGACKKGSDCDFQHIMDRGGTEPMRKATYTDRRASGSEWEFDERSMDQRASDNESIIERRYETESGYRPEKRSRTIPDSRLRDPRGTFEDIRERRHEIEQERRESPENPFMAAQRERERREAQDNNAGGRIINLSHLINPIAKEILRDSKRNREIERLSREESPVRSSQQSNSTK